MRIPKTGTLSVQNSTDKTPAGRALMWDDVRYFLAVARTGTLSGAARSLRVEHSTVARRVDLLEQALGFRLFDRLPRGWQLSAEGEALVAQAQALEYEALAFSRAALGVSAVQGLVRVSAPPVVASHLLVPRLMPLRTAWPGIDLEIVGESREANLARGEADLAVRLSRPTAPGLTARAIGEIGYGLYAAVGYTARPEADWQFLGYEDSLRQVPQQQWLAQVAGARRFVLRTNDLAALYQGARAGLGVTALPHFLGATDAALSPLPGAECPHRRRLWLVVHPDLRRSPRVRAVADALARLIDEARAVLLGPTGDDA